MTVSNMTIEAGARAGLVAPDAKTFAYLQGRPMAPKGVHWDAAVAYWSTLASDEGAVYDKEVRIEAADIAPQVTWGTSPEDVVPITGVVPDPADAPSDAKRGAMTRALEYMGLVPGTRMIDIAVDNVFIGSCTNGADGGPARRRRGGRGPQGRLARRRDGVPRLDPHQAPGGG